LSLVGGPAVAADVFHVQVVGPDGKTMRPYSGNVLGSRGAAEAVLPLACNDPPGKWMVTVKNVMSGEVRNASIQVE
jgi:hypothetical protein